MPERYLQTTPPIKSCIPALSSYQARIRQNKKVRAKTCSDLHILWSQRADSNR